jgi:hypothetical protein
MSPARFTDLEAELAVTEERIRLIERQLGSIEILRRHAPRAGTLSTSGTAWLDTDSVDSPSGSAKLPNISDNIAQTAVCTSDAGTVGTYCIESKSTGAAITNSYNSRSFTADISSTVNAVAYRGGAGGGGRPPRAPEGGGRQNGHQSTGARERFFQ